VPLVSWIVRALEGGVQGGELSVLGAGLYSVGIRKNRIVEYETALKSDKFLLVRTEQPPTWPGQQHPHDDRRDQTTCPAKESRLPRPSAIDAAALVAGGQCCTT
jgi:hypothetical protein